MRRVKRKNRGYSAGVIPAVFAYHDPQARGCERCRENEIVYRVEVGTMPGVTVWGLCSPCAALSLLEWDELFAAVDAA